ncbi:hypothetical protein GXM_08557 [Nostoc sphaeroides CCNUC1]|uniref:Uncharacterized protein n=1 Tax=Nostoc sphaeroides CCNUC1 TaxID=2653204 RepID=A0A5P8WE20_9NOSO|nr:hypothetical protein GXM_08557 [Nostoc sphaeroides CCNUC1]
MKKLVVCQPKNALVRTGERERDLNPFPLPPYPLPRQVTKANY